MSKKLSRTEALDRISAWDTEEVLCLLRKNGLEECCKAMVKRQIDGDELLHLTDGKLALWKSDLTRTLIGELWAFVQELNKSPEKYLSNKIAEAQQNDEHFSDSGSWGTDFEDETTEENNIFQGTQEIVKPSLIRSKQTALQKNRIPISRIPTRPPPKKTIKPEQEETYANCQDEEENTYANFQETKSPLTRNISKLHSQLEKTLAEKLKEELKRRNDPAKKPAIGPKPEILPLRKTSMTDKKFPQESFLHTTPKIHPRTPNEQNKTQRRMGVPPPPEPNKNKSYTSAETKKGFNKELPRPPPATIRNLDLVANLPARTEDSEDEDDKYESFENIEEMQQKNEISRVDSKQSLHSDRHGSVESVYKPPSATSHEEEEEDYEIYESIPEAAEDNDYLRPIQRIKDTQQGPPPLPAKPSLPSTLPNRTRPQKHKERSPDKKSATLPHVSSNSSLSTERATRPLPPPPERSYVDKPWYHNVTREQATTLIREQGTYNNPQDGYFLLRPSTTNLGNPLALVLWYKDRVYNVPVRKRSDSRYALGSPKVNELSFSTIEEIVAFYMKEELMLHSGGSTRLTDTPPK